MVRMDMALGDVAGPVLTPLKRIQYKDQPFFAESFSLPVYPSETVFAKKL